MGYIKVSVCGREREERYMCIDYRYESYEVEVCWCGEMSGSINGRVVLEGRS